MNRLRTVPLTVLTLLLWGCQGTDSPEAPAPAIAADPVVVYASYADTTYLPRLFEDFTKETGIIVIVRHGEPDAMVNDVIDGHISPPADVLLTRSVAGVARAADEGALRPLQSPVAIEQVAPWLRDVDGFWTALNYRRAVLAYDTDRVDFDELTDFQALADPQFDGKLCLAAVENSITLAVIAQWINELGSRDTELIVRGWANNLALPAFASEAGVLQAIAEGRCAMGLVSSNAFATAALGDLDAPFGSYEPINSYADIEGIGIARHARNPDGARQLVEWLLSPDVLVRHAAHATANEADNDVQSPRNVGLAAFYRDDALKLAERARYR